MIWGCGGLVRWRGWISDETDRFLIKGNIQVAYPAFILHSLLKPDSQTILKDVSLLLTAPVLGFATIASGFAIAWYVGKALGIKVHGGLRTFALGCGIYNYGFIPIPIILVVFPDSGLLGLLFLFNLGVEIAIWTVGMLMLSGKSISESWRKLVSPPVIAIILGLLLNLTGLAPHVPSFFVRFIQLVGQLAVPLAIFSGGVVVYDSLKLVRGQPVVKMAVASVVLRLLVIPAIMVMLALVLPLSEPMKLLLAIQASMPSGMFLIVLAKHYGGHIQVAVVVILATSLIGLFTIPACMPYFMRLLGV